ncbi:MAG: methyltransferase domain-containing protein [Deltaproteobacteria bacterium]|nr:methyltransferase domain-containing protein [Deltaproteobacteria bacterium]MBW2324223.1 methyltransferase domain-containing protein [Deltaproteobacteria bacterium]
MNTKDDECLPVKLKKWLPRFACPECKGEIFIEASSLICRSCSRKYLINRGVPILLPDSLRNMNFEEGENWQKIHAQLEAKYIDLDGDSFRHKMLEVAKDGFSDVQDGFFWEKRLFLNLKKPVLLKKNYNRLLEERNRLILSVFKDKTRLQNKMILNIGPGSDLNLIKIFEDEGAEVMNCDVIEDSLRFLSDNGKELLIAGDSRKLPFQTGTFDLVLALDVLHHVHPVSVPIREVYRVLRDEGDFYISELNKLNPLALVKKIFPKFVRKWQRNLLRKALKTDERPSIGSPHERVLSRNEVIMPLNEAGFIDVNVQVLNYVNPIFPQATIHILEAVARRFSRFLLPIASRYLYLATK